MEENRPSTSAKKSLLLTNPTESDRASMESVLKTMNRMFNEEIKLKINYGEGTSYKNPFFPFH